MIQIKIFMYLIRIEIKTPGNCVQLFFFNLGMVQFEISLVFDRPQSINFKLLNRIVHNLFFIISKFRFFAFLRLNFSAIHFKKWSNFRF